MHSSVHATENLLFITLLQLIVMILAARMGNMLLRRMGQPGVIGEIVAGLLLAETEYRHEVEVTIETTLELEDVSDRRIDVATHAHVTDKTLGACRSFKRIEGTAASP